MTKHYNNYDWDADGFPGEYVYGDDVYLDDYYMDERWKPDVDHGEYWVSTKGRVWSRMSNSFIHGSPYDDYGHIGLSLWVNKRKVFKSLHRMVAEAFIPNPYDLPIVRHLDDDPSNNCVWNLAWGFPVDNTRDCINNGHFRHLTDQDREVAMQKIRIPVIAVDLRTRREYTFESQSEAARCLGVKQGSIYAVLHGKYSNAGGYYFYRPGEAMNVDFDNYKYSRRFATILVTHLTTGRKFIFHSQAEAARVLNIAPSSVARAFNNSNHVACGYRFEYVDEEDNSNE